MKDDGFSTDLVRGCLAMMDGHCILYVKNVTEALRKHVGLRSKDDIVIRADLGNAFSRAACQNMNTKYIQICYEKVKNDLMRSRDRRSVWTGNSYRKAVSCLGFIEYFSDKTAATPRSTEILAYPVHAVLLSASA